MSRTANGTGADPPAAGETGTTRLRLLVPTIVFISSLMAVVSSLGAPLVPTIARADGVSLSSAQWMVTITLLAGALATPVMGRLADGPSQRTVILFALGTVAVGCALSAASRDFVLLIIGRGLQGVGLGLVPVTMAIARRSLSAADARRTIATLSVTTGIGVGIGYPVTGLIVQVFDYHIAYWIGAVTVTGALVLAVVSLPHRPHVVDPRRFDAAGAVLLSLVVMGISVVLSEGGGWGWTSTRTVGIVAGCLLFLAAWIPCELNRSDPLVDLRQVRIRSVLTANTAGFFISMVMFLVVPILVEFVQVPPSEGYGFGASVFVAGLVLVPLSAGILVASRLLIRYERRFGSRSMIPLGSVVLSCSTALFAIDHGHIWVAFVASGIIGLGVGFSFGAMPGFIVRAVPHGETGSATGLYQVVRGVGMSMGSALAAAVLRAHTHPGHTFPDVGGFRVALLIAAGLAGATAVISYVLPGRDPAPAVEPLAWPIPTSS
jgi:MFS family permease